MEKKMWSWVMLVSGGHFLVDFYANMLPPLLPFIAVMWGLNNAELALLVSMQSMTSHFLQPVFGYYMDKRPLKWSLAIGLIVPAVPMTFVYWSGGYQVFLLMIALAGVGIAMYHPLGATRVVYGEDRDKPLKMSVFSCFGSIGFALAPVVTAFVASAYGMKSLAFLIIPALVWGAAVLSGEKQRVAEFQGNHTGRPDKIRMGEFKPLLTLCAVVALRTWLINAATIFIPLWLVSQGVDEKTAGLDLTFFLLAGTLGGLVYGYIFQYTGTKKMLIGSFLLTLLLFPLFFYIAAFWRIWILVLLGFILIGTAPVTIVIGQRILPLRAGLASGVSMGLAFGIGGLGILLTGFFADRWGTVTALLLTMLAIVPAIFLALFLDDSAKAVAEQGEMEA